MHEKKIPALKMRDIKYHPIKSHVTVFAKRRRCESVEPVTQSGTHMRGALVVGLQFFLFG